MTDISIKNRIAVIVTYLITASVLTIQHRHPFAVVYFLFVGLAIVFAEKIFDNAKIHNRTVTAFIVTVFCHQTFFQIFYKTHGDIEQILTALATAIFLAGVFALTDEKKLPVSIVAAPLICFANTKIAFCYSMLLFTVSVVKFQLIGKNSTQKTEKKKRSKSHLMISTRNLLIASMIISAVCFIACIYPAIKDTHRIVEAYDYFLVHFKNIPFVIIASVYLLVRLLKSNIGAKAGLIAGFTVNLISAVVFYFVYVWTMVSIFCVANVLFCALVGIENKKTVDLIKDDFIKHKYIFFAGMICILM